MVDRRLAQKKGSGWIVALPPMVRARLKLTEPGPVYWHLGRRGEAILTRGEERKAGAPDTTGLLGELADARALIDKLRRREDSRDRAMYAEGYALGVINTQERMLSPHGKSAQGAMRRRLWAYQRSHPEPSKEGGATVPFGDVSTPGASRRRARRPRAVVDAGDVSKVDAPKEQPVETLAEADAVTDSAPPAAPDLAEVHRA